MQRTETAILVAITDKDSAYTKTSLEELKKLCESADISIADSIFQNRRSPDPAYYVGYGFAEELGFRCREEHIDVIVFDNELTFVQEKNLEELTQVKIISRAMVILDIFAKRAQTYEGKLQVECAQLEYLYPRLLGKGMVMSRLGGGIGTRGPGETKLEQDRRRIRKRIKILHTEIQKVRNVRRIQRNKRQQLPLVSLIGYTNAGKSTLLNAITQSNAYIEDRLFSTVDPLIRKYQHNGETILFSDTVGFISKIPHQLIDAFHATLEEVIEADILLHVIDATDHQQEKKIAAVLKTLEDIGAAEKKIITVFNKCDKKESYHSIIEKSDYNFFVSAYTGQNVKTLVEYIQKQFYGDVVEEKIVLPIKHASLLQYIYMYSDIIEKNYTEHSIELKIKAHAKTFDAIQKKLVHTITLDKEEI